jgi:hypothetical protein
MNHVRGEHPAFQEEIVIVFQTVQRLIERARG